MKLAETELNVGITQHYASDIQEMLRKYPATKDCHIWQLTRHNRWPKSLDLIVLSGGTDISSDYYGEQPDPRNDWPDHNRDELERDIFYEYANAFKVGCCRGGQMLHVLSGGKLNQHISDHRFYNHPATDQNTGEKIVVSSIHHQEMRRGHPDAEYFLISSDGIVEGVWHKKTKSLCFQFHPEWGPKSCTDYAFKMLEKYWSAQ